MIDARREAGHISREFGRYHTYIGEAVIWLAFDVEASEYDTVYDEGYRQYQHGRRIPVLWIDQQEATEDYGPEGRRPTQRLRFAVSARALAEAGIPVGEAHGGRVQDTQIDHRWADDRLNDMVYYDGRFYAVSNFQIRGRVQGEDVIIGVSAVETQASDELNLDSIPSAWFPAPPPRTPVTPSEGGEVYYGPDQPTNPAIGDIWLDTDP